MLSMTHIWNDPPAHVGRVDHEAQDYVIYACRPKI